MANNMNWNGDAIKNAAGKAAFEALRDVAGSILNASINECPIDTGTLRRSGVVTSVESKQTVYVSYNTPYAIKQHEDLTLNHPNGGNAKYLENPFKARVGDAKRYVASKVDEFLRSQG